jgi:hypothetical protein
MTKKIIFSLFALMAASAVQAQYRDSHEPFEELVWNAEKLNVLLDTRLDMSSTISDSQWDQLSFNGHTLKVWFAGEIVPGIRYRVRHRLNRPQPALERDNFSAATDHAWVAFDLGTRWTLTAGKQSVQFGTFEYDYNPADIYLGSMAYDDLDAYKTGVDAAFKAGGQTFHLQVVNSDSPQFATPEYGKKALGTSFLWEGNLFDGTLKTRWGYSAFQYTESKFYHWLTAGTQLNLGGFSTELDYYLGDRTMDYTSTVGLPAANPRAVRDQSAAVNVEYVFDKWRPFIKALWNERYDKALGSAAYESYGIQAVAEYYPFHREELKDLRFHAAWMYSRTDFRGTYAALASQNRHTFLLGMRWLFKVK